MDLTLEHTITKAVLVDYENMPKSVHIVNVDTKAYKSETPETFVIVPYMFILSKPQLDLFTAYEDITKDNVIAWLSGSSEWLSYLNAINDKYLIETLPTSVIDNPW